MEIIQVSQLKDYKCISLINISEDTTYNHINFANILSIQLDKWNLV